MGFSLWLAIKASTCPSKALALMTNARNNIRQWLTQNIRSQEITVLRLEIVGINKKNYN